MRRAAGFITLCPTGESGPVVRLDYTAAHLMPIPEYAVNFIGENDAKSSNT